MCRVAAGDDPGAPLGGEVETSFEDLADLAARGETIQQAVLAAEAAWDEGDHAVVVEALRPVLDDPVTWALVRQVDVEGVAAEIAYQGGISRLQCGDADGAAAWLGLVADDPDCPDAVRRGLAQVHLARGAFDEVARLLDLGPGAAPFDLAVATYASGLRGAHDEVVAHARACFEAMDATRGELHPWDVAGVNVLVGLALAEVGEGDMAMVAADNALALVEGTPPTLPIRPQALTVVAAACRLAGDLDGADRALGETWELLAVDTADRGAAEREAGRCCRQAGREDAARDWFARAATTYRAAGHTWLADAVEAEATAGA